MLEQPPLKTEIVVVASGKGGTGKTVILASLGYALQTSGLRVLYVDTDTATDGLSLFLLGPDGPRAQPDVEPKNTYSGFLRAIDANEVAPDATIPFRVNRVETSVGYDVFLSSRGLYGNVDEEIGQQVMPSLTREQFQNAIKRFFDEIKASNKWDYVLIDTRGGFGYNTTDVCALADSFFLVTEANPSSFFQDKSLMARISVAANDLGRKPYFRGVIVNKATDGFLNDPGAAGVQSLDLSKVEVKFRDLASSVFQIRYDDTYAVPIDVDVVNAYRWQQVTYIQHPGSVFSYATLSAFSSLMSVVSVRWPEENVRMWNEFVNRISTAIKSENEATITRSQQQEALLADKLNLETEVARLRAQTEETKKSYDVALESLQYLRSKDEVATRNAALAAKSSRNSLLGLAGVSALLGVAAFAIYSGYSITGQAAKQQNDRTQVIEAQLNSLQSKNAQVEQQLSTINNAAQNGSILSGPHVRIFYQDASSHDFAPILAGSLKQRGFLVDALSAKESGANPISNEIHFQARDPQAEVVANTLVSSVNEELASYCRPAATVRPRFSPTDAKIDTLDIWLFAPCLGPKLAK